jgi:sugar (pentulose or hexulose) kinase
MFAPLRPAHDTLSFLKPEIAERLGLGPETRVLCGIHDSSASLLPHLQAREAPFAVLSTGTWTIALAVGGDLDRLDPKRDTLAYVTPFGDPVPAARCMGGREFELLVGGVAREPDKGELTHVLEEQVMALPTFVPGVGPFPHGEGRWTHDPETLSPGERRGAASLYLALMAVELLRCTGAGGPTIIEGPLAANWVFSAALAAITGRPVMPSAGTGGTTRGAVCLLDPKRALAPSEGAPVAPLPCEALPGYARAWRERAAG